MASLGTLAVNLVARTEKFSKGLAKSTKDVKGFRAKLVQLKPSAAGVATALAGVTTALTAMGTAFAAKAVKDFVEFGDKMDKMAARTGLGVEALTALKFAAEQSGTSIDSLGQALFRSTRRVANAATGTGPAVRALEELGISAGELSKLGAEQRFLALVKALEGVGNEGRRAQLGFEIFGDNVRDLVPLLNQGEQGIRQLMAQAESLGLTLGTDDAAAAAALSDSMNRLSSSIKGVTLEIGGALSGPLKEWTDWLTDSIKLIRTLKDEFPKLTAGITTGGGAIGKTIRDSLLRQFGIGAGAQAIIGGAGRAAGSIAGERLLDKQLEEQHRMNQSLTEIATNTATAGDQITVTEVTVP